MLSREELDRINFLANKKKSEGLTDAEAQEQQELRKKYLANFRKSFRNQLDNIEIVDPEDDKKGVH